MKANSTTVLGIAEPRRASKWQFYWLCGLLLSFAYERPLVYVTPYDRTNPRLFDVLVVIGLITVLPRLRFRPILPAPLKIWAILVGWFCFCAIIWAIFLPWEYGQFSLYRAATYVEGLLAIYMVLLIPLDARRKRILHGMIVLGGIFIAIYCIPQYVRGDTEVQVLEDLAVTLGEGVMAGPFSSSYFQLAQTSSLCVAFALTYFMPTQSIAFPLRGLLVISLIGWPLLFSGARTGLGLLIISTVMLLILERRVRRLILYAAVLSLFLMALVNLDESLDVIRHGATIERLYELEDDINGIGSRLGIILEFPFSDHQAGYLLPLVGAGFYVAPVFLGSEGILYRVDFGLHNIYLFAFEQAGVVGVLLFLWFLLATIRDLRGRNLKHNSTDLDFSTSLLAYVAASMIMGLGAHNFWQGFASGNFNSYFMVCLVLAVTPSADVIQNTNEIARLSRNHVVREVR